MSLLSDAFFFLGDEARCESPSKYKPGGLHPVLIGDVLPKPTTCVSDASKPAQYHVLLKLGFGAFSTVWLARDLIDERYVSIKIGSGMDAATRSREAQILSRLSSHPSEHPESKAVIEFYEDFIIKGPNGFHECLVTEVVAPLADRDVWKHCSAGTIRQTVKAFAFLHQQDIIHGDPHVGNVGIALPELAKYDQERILDYFGPPEVVPLVPRDPSVRLCSHPHYMAPSERLMAFLKRSRSSAPPAEPSIRIFDFGRSYVSGEGTPQLLGAAPLAFRPPEMVMGELYPDKAKYPWTKASDIWALGCTLYSMALMPSTPVVTDGSLADYLFEAVDFGGPPPDTWRKLWNSSGYDDKANRLSNKARGWELLRSDLRQSEVLEEEDKSVLVDLLMQMIVTNPDERASLAALLSHPFMKGECK